MSRHALALVTYTSRITFSRQWRRLVTYPDNYAVLEIISVVYKFIGPVKQVALAYRAGEEEPARRAP